MIFLKEFVFDSDLFRGCTSVILATRQATQGRQSVLLVPSKTMCWESCYFLREHPAFVFFRPQLLPRSTHMDLMWLSSERIIQSKFTHLHIGLIPKDLHKNILSVCPCIWAWGPAKWAHQINYQTPLIGQVLKGNSTNKAVSSFEQYGSRRKHWILCL